MRDSPEAATGDAPDLMLGALRLARSAFRLHGADGRPVTVERKAFDLLHHLVAAHPRLVDKDELLAKVWGRSIASDSVIAQAVSKARRALSAGGGDPAWIDVVRGAGYRYVGPVAPATTTADQASPASRRIRPRWLSLVAAGVLVTAGLVAGIAWQRQAVLRDPLRIAVLPWRNDTGDVRLDWTRLGLQGLVVDALANDRRVLPVAQSSVRALLAARPDLVDAQAQAEYLGTATGARHVFAGRLRRDDAGLHVELVVLGDRASASVELAGDQPADLALAASAGVTRHLLPGFDPERPEPLSRIAFANEAYARGIDARLAGDAAAAARHLESAIAADPTLLAARYQLSLAWQTLRRNDEWRRTLDDLLAMAQARGDRLHAGQALAGQGVLAWREARYPEARALLLAARDLFDGGNDGLRRAAAEGNLGSLAAIRGDFDEAEAAMRRALAVFESAGQQVEVARVAKNLGILALDRGRPDEAAHWIERSLAIRQGLGLERDLAESLSAMASIDMARSRPAAAQASYERAAAVFARHGDPLLESDTLARLVNALVDQGRLGEAQSVAGRSLAAARSADNPAARCLAQLKLAQVARLRGDREGAGEDLSRAQAECTDAQDQRGLFRVAAERAELALVAAPDTAHRAVADALEIAVARGDDALHVEALLLRARLPGAAVDAAAADVQKALTLARAVGDRGLVATAACARIGLAGVPVDDLALSDCRAAADGNPVAAAALARHALSGGDPARARHWLRRQRQLAGEAWSDLDEALWRELGAGERQD